MQRKPKVITGYIAILAISICCPFLMAQEVPGQFIVTLKESAQPQPSISAMSEGVTGVKISTLSSATNTVLVTVDNKAPNALTAIQRAFAMNDRVISVEPNRYIRPCLTPNDPRFPQQTHLVKVGAPVAWDKSTGNATVLVAVIDTGILTAHEDLSQNIWHNPTPSPTSSPVTLPDTEPYYPGDAIGWNFPGNSSDVNAQLFPVVLFPSIPKFNQAAVLDPELKKFESHGTHVAGLIGATGDNGVGGCGVAWSVRLMPLKVLDGPESLGTVGDAIQAINYAILHKARIINMSWGLPQYSDKLADAISKANDAGVLMVVAAGNDGNDLSNGHYFYPACLQLANMICVAATDGEDQLIDTSNYGVKTVDVAAPGLSIISTVPTLDEQTQKPVSGYDSLTGTSMAAALVTGEAALLMSRYPSLSAHDIREIIISTCDALTDKSAGKLKGGRINMAKALGTLPLPNLLAKRLEALPADKLAMVEKSLTDEARAHLFVMGNSVMSGLAELPKATSGTSKQDLLVQVRQGVTIEQLQHSVEGQGGKVIGQKAIGNGLYQVQVESPGRGIILSEGLRRDKNVMSVEKNEIIRPQGQP